VETRRRNNINNLDARYQALLEDILQWGVEKKDRTGTGTISVFGRQIRHKMSEGFPLLTTKKMHWNSIVTELLWFLRGETNIKFLLDYDCHIWDGDAYKNYCKFIESDANQNNKLEIVKIPESKEIFIKTIKCDNEIVRKMGRRYCENFAKQWGELGPIYGKQWRQWELPNYSFEHVEYGADNDSYVDQIQNLINDLKTNPDSRRLMVNAWNVGELNQMVLPPCHYGFQVYTRELSIAERLDLGYKTYKELFEPFDFYKVDHEEIDELYPVPRRAISLMWNQRSVDTFLGLPFNIASYGLLLEIIAKEVNMVPDELIGNLGDAHLYSNHIDQAKEQIGRTPYELPTVKITERNWYMHEKVKEHLGEKTLDEKLKSYRPDCFELIGYESHPKIKAPLSN
jgi:thymidylate synthase